jgi:hypothetical protein
MKKISKKKQTTGKSKTYKKPMAQEIILKLTIWGGGGSCTSGY